MAGSRGTKHGDLNSKAAFPLAETIRIAISLRKEVQAWHTSQCSGLCVGQTAEKMGTKDAQGQMMRYQEEKGTPEDQAKKCGFKRPM